MSGLGWKGGSASNALPPGPCGSRQRRSWPASPLILPACGAGMANLFARVGFYFGLGCFLRVLRGALLTPCFRCLDCRVPRGAHGTRLTTGRPPPPGLRPDGRSSALHWRTLQYLEGASTLSHYGEGTEITGEPALPDAPASAGRGIVYNFAVQYPFYALALPAPSSPCTATVCSASGSTSGTRGRSSRPSSVPTGCRTRRRTGKRWGCRRPRPTTRT